MKNWIKKWNWVIKAIITTIVGIVIGYVLSGKGL